MDTYNVNSNCENCGYENSFDIPKGTTVKEYKVGKAMCKNCSCLITPAKEE